MCDQSVDGNQQRLVEDRQALDVLFSATYAELRRLASSIISNYAQATLTPTSLVNEAWFKLARTPEVAGVTPLHFKRIAACAMRQVLVEGARRRATQRRNNGSVLVEFDVNLAAAQAPASGRDILALDAALDELEKISPRQARLVEVRFFAGLEVEECAESLGCSRATVVREWRHARAWLACRIQEHLAGHPSRPGAASAQTAPKKQSI